MIIGTAGHIDHGKSALVTALTGRAMDRLAEEQRRGITIDLNFAPLRFEGLPPAGIVDVPGHEDFVRTMVAGASGIDLVLLVIDAAQGPQPQTWEHLAIVEQLRIPRGIPVLTKADLTDPEWIELVGSDVTDRLRDSPVAFAPPAVVSALTGQGIAELLARLRKLAAEPLREAGPEGFRMPLDRAFSIAGVGTVVTGTPWSGSLRVGDAVSVLPSRLSGKVRSLEAYGAPVSVARPGERTAVGITGIERTAIHRGETLLDLRLPWQTTTALDAQLELLPESPPLRRQLRVRVHLGTAEVLARVYPRGEILPGGQGLARLALEQPVVARGGDRLVLRSYSPVMTIGGGRVLDPLPPRRAPWPPDLAALSQEAWVRALVERRPGGIVRDDLPILIGEALAAEPPGVMIVGGRYVAEGSVTAIQAQATALVRAHHERSPGDPGISLETLRRGLKGPAPVVRAALDALLEEGKLLLVGGLVALPGFVPRLAGGTALLDRVVATLEAAGLEPPSVADLAAQLGEKDLLPALRIAAQQQRVIAVQNDRFFSTGSLERFVTTLRQFPAGQPITPAALRDRLGLSRKFLIPLLEWADRAKVTRRVGDARLLT